MDCPDPLLGYTLSTWEPAGVNTELCIPDVETDLLVCWMVAESVSVVPPGLSAVLVHGYWILDFVPLLIQQILKEDLVSVGYYVCHWG